MSLRRGARPGRRDIRKKGFILSFGDIILPFVGVVAIGLLVVAGKLFFMSGLTPSASIISIQPDVVPDNPVPPNIPPSVPMVADAPEVTIPPTDGPVDAPVQGGGAVPLEITATPVVETSPPDPSEEGEPVLPASQTGTKAVTPAKNTVKKSAPAASTNKKPQGPVWRVQVGAYGSKQAANEIVGKLARSGYAATVYSGPKFHKVWVQAGNTKQSAEMTASRLKKAGFPGSYVVPPSSR